MKRISFALFLIALLIVAAGPVMAHCEIPCGIYDDKARIAEIGEHITTIEKSIQSIEEIRNAEEKNYNQLTRWVTSKEDHANKIQHVVTQYFMTQRIKPADAADEVLNRAYTHHLKLLHQMLVSAMKTKQTLELSHVQKLRDTLKAFEQSYFAKT